MERKRWALFAGLAAMLTLPATDVYAGNGTLKGYFKYVDPATGAVQSLNSSFIYLRSASKPPPMEKYFSKADYILGPTSNGFYSVSVPEGNYYVRILRRKVVGTVTKPYGPPEEGDLTWFQTAPITITSGATLDLGTKYAQPFSQAPIRVTGTVTSQTGAPVSGRFVRAQTAPCLDQGWDGNVNQCGPDKLIALQPTDAQGKFTLYLKDPGTYYFYTSPCLTAEYREFSGNQCGYTAGPGPVTLSVGDVRTLNMSVYTY